MTKRTIMAVALALFCMSSGLAVAGEYSIYRDYYCRDCSVEVSVNGVTSSVEGALSETSPNTVAFKLLKADPRLQGPKVRFAGFTLVILQKDKGPIASLVGMLPSQAGDGSAITIPALNNLTSHEFFAFPNIPARYVAVANTGNASSSTLATAFGSETSLSTNYFLKRFIEKLESAECLAVAGFDTAEKKHALYDPGSEKPKFSFPEFALLERGKAAVYRGKISPEKGQAGAVFYVRFYSDISSIEPQTKVDDGKVITTVSKVAWEYAKKAAGYPEKLSVAAGIDKDKAAKMLDEKVFELVKAVDPLEYFNRSEAVLLGRDIFERAKIAVANRGKIKTEVFQRGDLLIWTADSSGNRQAANRDVAFAFKTGKGGIEPAVSLNP